ncbi:MAG: hypothetical protein WKG06_35900 [Segetibacter sp.]
MVTYNTPELLKQMLPSLEVATGKGKTVEMEWVTGAEDYSFFGQKVPSLFFYLGWNAERDKTQKQHRRIIHLIFILMTVA